MSLTKATYSMISGAVVNVLDFGADPTGVADSTVAIQAAIDSLISGTVYFPNGTYSINATLNIDASTQYARNLVGNGLASKIQYDGTTSTIPMVYYQNGSNSAMPTIEGLQFVNNYRTGDTTLNGVVGLRIGKKDAAATTGAGGTCNVTVRKNQFQYCQSPIEIYNESDQVTIEENYFFVWTAYGVFSAVNAACTSGCGSSSMRVHRNHFMGGQDGSWAIRIKGAACSVTDNVIQNATEGAGIYCDTAENFVVSCNYTESTGASSFIYLDESKGGYIGENQIGGYPGAVIIDIAATSSNINIGQNSYSVSGGVPISHVRIAGGATGINIIGSQAATSGVSNLIVGSPDFFAGGDGAVTSSASVKSPLITTEREFVNISAASSSTLFTAVANACYLVNVSQETEDYAATYIVTVLGDSATAIVTSLYATNANLSVTATGLVINANNGVGATRTVTYGFIRIA